MRHIFYPTLQLKLDKNLQGIQRVHLNGFHHDEFEALEKSGLFTFRNKVYGKAEFGAEEFFKADVDFGNGIICEDKTFFPSSYSREKIAECILQASQNRVEDISDSLLKKQKKYVCKSINNISIEILVNKDNVIISGYPSNNNF